MEGISVLGFILAILYLITTKFACNGYTHIYNALQYEQEALVDFKNGLNDSNNRLSSWKGSNYCHWQGITCENGTGAVISIDLHNPYSREDANENWSSMELSGEIRPSLIKLKYLKYLDLSSNSFKAIPIPQFFGSLKNLLYLNFSNAGFSGAIPSNLGNLSNLEYLDLSSKYSNDFSVDNIEWMIGLVSLKHLGMDFVDLSLVGSQWVEVLNKLPVLTELHLASCKLFGSIPSPSFVNFTSLAVINISSNGFNSTFPEWLLNVSSLISIDIRYNQLHGWIPLGLGELANLQYLDLSSNYYLKGNISQLLRKSWKKIEVLYLHINELHGTIPSSIGNFCHLKYLDMTTSRLTGSLPEFLNGTENCGSKNPLPNLISFFLSQNQLIGKLPNWLGQLQSLAYLDLSSNYLQGIIPTSFWLGQLQNLVSLDLSFNTLQGTIPTSFWLGQLQNLASLDLSFNKLQGIIPTSLWLGQPQNLVSLDLSSNELQGSIPSFIGNFCNLKYLDLRNNYLNGSLSEIMKGTENCSCKSPLPNLMELHLENNQLMGKLPNWLGELKNLRELDLSNNKLEGPIPASLGTLQHLEVMSLEWNELTGSLPVSIGQLSELYALDVSFNQLSGTLSEQHFWKLSNLKYLDVYPNSFSLNVSPNWVPPFQVIYLYMGSCHLGPAFPTWLQSQKSLRRFDFSNASISGFIPNWFWNISSTLLQTVILSDNQLQGQLPNSLKFSYKAVIDFSSNLLDGPIPSSTKGVDTLDLSNNKFSGPIPLSSGESMLGLNSLLLSDNQITGVIPSNIGKSMPDLSYLSLSNNQITGAIPSNMGEFLPSLSFLSISGNRITGTIPGSIGHMIGLRVVDFSRNNLIGSIPSTINNCSNLIVLDLGNNNLSGVIPRSLGQLKSLQSLHLNHNKLAGEFPSSFRNLTSLEVLDLSYNKLWGQVPTWIEAAFINLVILNLRSNAFSGRLPSQISNLSSLHVLDLAQNNLMGEIPVTLVELKAMAREQLNIYKLYENGSSLYEERLVVTTKGQSLEYTRTLSLVVGIDLSDNNLSGEFPQGITKLIGLVVLNLSRNHITGQISESISLLRQLSSLDLSSNKLSGTIPLSMPSLTFLGYLNLSNNNFSGKIPFTGQMTTFTELAFVGNPNLCGAPLVKKCLEEDLDKKQSAIEDKKDVGYIDQWFYLSVGLGFAVGILVPYFVLAIRKSWCEAYFDFVDEIVKWLLRGKAIYAKNYPKRQ